MLRASSCGPVLASMLVAGAIGACSLFVDTDGLQGGASGSDAGGSTNDASPDATTLKDASPPLDGSPDVDGSTTPFCASHPGHSLCFDFDESTSIPAVDALLFDPGHVFVDDTTSVSPSQSLAIVYPAGTASNEAIEKDLPQTNGGVLSIAFDIRYTANDLTAGQTIAMSIGIPHAAGLSDHFFYLQSYLSNVDLAETVTPDDGGASDFPATVLVSPIPADTWMHVAMSVDGISRKWTISFNGVALPDTQAEVGFGAGPAHVAIGGYSSAQLTSQTTVHIDNVLVDY